MSYGGPLRAYDEWERRQRRRARAEAILAWVLVILAGFGVAAIAWIIIAVVLVVA